MTLTPSAGFFGSFISLRGLISRRLGRSCGPTSSLILCAGAEPDRSGLNDGSGHLEAIDSGRRHLQEGGLSASNGNYFQIYGGALKVCRFGSMPIRPPNWTAAPAANCDWLRTGLGRCRLLSRATLYRQWVEWISLLIFRRNGGSQFLLYV